MLTRANLIKGLRASGGTTPVREVMTKGVPTVHGNEKLATASEVMRKSPASVVAVIDGRQRLLGYINAENLAELILVGTSLRLAK